MVHENKTHRVVPSLISNKHVIGGLKIAKMIFLSGLWDGQGKYWWGIPYIGYLIRGTHRPKMFEIRNAQKILVENMTFLNSPRWTFWAHEVKIFV